MGMAASQARYLALVARKTNCEYEGQQINQARTALANQSANLFNQMLGLSVPVPPSTQDFTTLQYSFTDGINGSVIDKWEQLATPDEQGYNYIVDYHYNANVYHGYQKKMNDPQIQFNFQIPSPGSEATDINAIQTALVAVNNAQKDYDAAIEKYNQDKEKASKSVYYSDRNSLVTSTFTSAQKIAGPPTVYEVKYTDPNPTAQTLDFKDYTSLSTTEQAKFNIYAQQLVDNGVAEDLGDLQARMVYVYDATNGGVFAFKDEVLNMQGIDGSAKHLSLYFATDAEKANYHTSDGTSIQKWTDTLADDKNDISIKLSALELAKADYAALNKPTFVGNNALTPLSEITEDQLAELKQIIKDMEANGGSTNLTKCFTDYKSTQSMQAKDYHGGIYTFEQNGVTYYTTYYDLVDTADASNGINKIDQQPKLSYYHANYVEEPIHTKERAILETDANGRFSSVRFKDGSRYTLNVEEITDDDAYQDAMNAWTYKNARYDKMVQDINAKTSIIQAEDRQLELRLKQLDTEQSALSNEIEAVSKVVKDNVEKSFKTFGG